VYSVPLVREANGFTPLNALLLPKLNGKSNIAGSLTSYLSSILFNWGGEINHGQRTTDNTALFCLSELGKFVPGLLMDGQN